jgi:hypothetical protein
MDLLDNGGRELGQWPPFPLEHFREKWNSLFGKCARLSAAFSGKAESGFANLVA